jgi:hypothetical protein
VEIGVTHKDEIAEEFGQPTIERLGGSHWRYRALKRDTEWEWYLLLPGSPPQNSGGGTSRFSLLFDFDANGFVEGYAVCRYGKLNQREGATKDCTEFPVSFEIVRQIDSVEDTTPIPNWSSTAGGWNPSGWRGLYYGSSTGSEQDEDPCPEGFKNTTDEQGDVVCMPQ